MEKEKAPQKRDSNKECVCKAAVIKVIVTESVVGSGLSRKEINKIIPLMENNSRKHVD